MSWKNLITGEITLVIDIRSHNPVYTPTISQGHDHDFHPAAPLLKVSCVSSPAHANAAGKLGYGVCMPEKLFFSLAKS